MDKVEAGIKAATQNWQDPNLANGDTNTIDVLWCADNLYPKIDGFIDTKSLNSDKLLALVNLVEGHFINSLIRNLIPEDLMARAKNLAQKIEENNLLKLQPVESVAIALYLWHGCLCMAKNTRVEDSQGTQYNLVMRNRDYIKLRNEWESAERMQNPWIKRGVSVAKLFSEGRKDSIVNDWVPKDSPYWGIV